MLHFCGVDNFLMKINYVCPKKMPYIQLKVEFSDNVEIARDILISELGSLAFESFEEDEKGVNAYVKKDLFDEVATKSILDAFMLNNISCIKYHEIEDKNWNDEWEKNFFAPIFIGTECLVRSSFHTVDRKATYEILIDPKMAFGTGHHETTSLVLEKLLSLDIAGMDVLDMGCGTAILAILAKMKGAARVEGIDNDEWAYNNALENVNLNNVSDIAIKLGDALLLGAQTFDLVIANINRNILLNDMAVYVGVMKESSTLLMSGFYKEDIPMIKEKAESLGLVMEDFSEKKNWVVTCFRKG